MVSTPGFPRAPHFGEQNKAPVGVRGFMDLRGRKEIESTDEAGRLGIELI